MRSILEQARSDGYREGWDRARQVVTDDAYELGRQAANEDAPSRLRWALLGAIAVAIADYFI